MSVDKKPHKNDIHPLDTYIKPLGNLWLMLILSIISTNLGFLLACKYQDVSWISRMGGVNIIIGLLLTMSPMFRNGLYISQSSAGRFGSVHGNVIPEEKKIGNAVAIGVILSIIGTILNVFGDLIFRSIIISSS